MSTSLKTARQRQDVLVSTAHTTQTMSKQCYARPKKVGNTYHKLTTNSRSRRKATLENSEQTIIADRTWKNMTQSLDNLRTQNNKTTTTGNIEEIDIEMADTAEEDDITTPPQEDSLPALGGDDDIRDIEQEQLQSDRVRNQSTKSTS
ncbi:hypothetical protein ACQRIU_005934 [Beauveria bassiana]